MLGECIVSAKRLLSFFTKTKLKAILESLEDYSVRNSWKKDRMLEQIEEYGLETVLNLLTTKQLKDVLEEQGASITGTKAALVQRILTIESGDIEVSDRDSDLSSDITTDELGRLLHALHYYGINCRSATAVQDLRNEVEIKFDDPKFETIDLSGWTYVGLRYLEVWMTDGWATADTLFINGNRGIVVGSTITYDGGEYHGAAEVQVGQKNVKVYTYTIDGQPTSFIV